jgi:hypothetical protein
MTWARAAIFYGSEQGRIALNHQGVHGILASTLPALVTSACCQLINNPLFRSVAQSALWVSHQFSLFGSVTISSL